MLGRVGLRFRSKFKVLNGQHFYGQILDLPDTSRVSNFLSARRYLRVTANSPITAGEVIEVGNQKFITAEHGVGFFGKSIYKHFKLFLVDQERNWYSNTYTTDPVKGTKKVSGQTNNGLIYLSVQPKSPISDSIKIQSPRHEVVTNNALSVDDKLGSDWVVTRVDRQLGIYVVEVKEG